MNKKLQELQSLGQSVWLDSIERGQIKSGELQQLFEEGIHGETANPTNGDSPVSIFVHYSIVAVP